MSTKTTKRTVTGSRWSLEMVGGNRYSPSERTRRLDVVVPESGSTALGTEARLAPALFACLQMQFHLFGQAHWWTHHRHCGHALSSRKSNRLHLGYITRDGVDDFNSVTQQPNTDPLFPESENGAASPQNSGTQGAHTASCVCVSVFVRKKNQSNDEKRLQTTTTVQATNKSISLTTGY